MIVYGKRKRSEGKKRFWSTLISFGFLGLLIGIATVAVAVSLVPKASQDSGPTWALSSQMVDYHNIRMGDSVGAIFENESEINLVRLRWHNFANIYSIVIEKLSEEKVQQFIFPSSECGVGFCSLDILLPDGMYVWKIFYISYNSPFQCCVGVDAFTLR